jgi:hypothetical protein
MKRKRDDSEYEKGFAVPLEFDSENMLKIFQKFLQVKVYVGKNFDRWKRHNFQFCSSDFSKKKIL